MNISKTEMKFLDNVKTIASGCASASILSQVLGLRIKTIKQYVKRLAAKGLLLQEKCTFHKNTFFTHLQLMVRFGRGLYLGHHHMNS